MSPAPVTPQYISYEQALKTDRIIRGTEHSVDVIKSSTDPVSPLFSVVMRTQSNRNELMEQSLLCLVAQECQSFEIVVVAHNVEDKGIEHTLSLLDSFGSQFKNRVTVLRIAGGQRGVPLNEGIDVARGKYVVFLDDDDLVFAHWLSEFMRVGEENPGKIIRSRCVDRFVKGVENPRIPSYVQSNLIDSRARFFSLTEHFFISQTVLHSYATPREAIISEQSYFDETYPVVEDWDFLLRNAELWGVVDTDSITCIYNRWMNSGSSLHLHDSGTWEDLHNRVFQRFNDRGLLIGPQELTKLYRMWLEHERFKSIASSMLKNGDGLMVNKKENALSRSIQYAQYDNGQLPVLSKRQAVKMLIITLLPAKGRRVLIKLVKRRRPMSRSSRS